MTCLSNYNFKICFIVEIFSFLGPLDKITWTADGQLLAVSTVKGKVLHTFTYCIEQYIYIVIKLRYLTIERFQSLNIIFISQRIKFILFHHAH